MTQKPDTEPKTCSRCHARPASTPRTAYCKSCRAEYQREWRRRRRGDDRRPVDEPVQMQECPAGAEGQFEPAAPRLKLRGTPTLAEMQRFRLI